MKRYRCSKGHEWEEEERLKTMWDDGGPAQIITCAFPPTEPFIRCARCYEEFHRTLGTVEEVKEERTAAPVKSALDCQVCGCAWIPLRMQVWHGETMCPECFDKKVLMDARAQTIEAVAAPATAPVLSADDYVPLGMHDGKIYRPKGVQPRGTKETATFIDEFAEAPDLKLQEYTAVPGMICSQCMKPLEPCCFAVGYESHLSPVCSERCGQELRDDVLKLEAKMWGPSRPGDFMGIDYWIKKDVPSCDCGAETAGTTHADYCSTRKV